MTISTKMSEKFDGLAALIGNTGIAFSAIGAYLGNPVTISMPNWMGMEQRLKVTMPTAKAYTWLTLTSRTKAKILYLVIP